MGPVHPPELNRTDAVLPLAADIQDAVTFRAQQPFVTGSRECIYMEGVNVNRVHSQTLNGIHEEETAMRATAFAQCLQINPESTQIIDETDRKQTGALDCGGDLFHRIVDGKPGDLNTSRFKLLPWKVVRRKLLLEADHPVALLPWEPEGNDADSLGGILHQSDLFG